jgi:hypothetical protein
MALDDLEKLPLQCADDSALDQLPGLGGSFWRAAAAADG